MTLPSIYFLFAVLLNLSPAFLCPLSQSTSPHLLSERSGSAPQIRILNHRRSLSCTIYGLQSPESPWQSPAQSDLCKENVRAVGDGRKEIQAEAGEEMETQQLGSPALEPLHSEATLSHKHLLVATRCSVSSAVGKRSWSSHTVVLKGKHYDAMKPQEGTAEETPLRTCKVV